MQVIDPGAPPPALQVPCAEIVGLQFGLATSKEFIGHSILKSRVKEGLKNLVDPRLGLPAENEICTTCGGTNYEECTGHFAHLKLTQPIYHPNHMRLVQKIFQSICVGCGVPKTKKKKIIFKEGETRWKQTSLYNEREDVIDNGGALVVAEAAPVENDAADAVITLSSDDEMPPDILHVIPHGPIDFTMGSTSQSPLPQLPPSGSSKGKGKAHANGSFDPGASTKGGKASKKSASTKSPSTKSNPESSKGKIYKGRPKGLDVLDPPRRRKSAACPYCTPGDAKCRPITVKILPVKGRKLGDSSETIQLEIQDNDDDVWLPGDFWSFLGGPSRNHDEEARVPMKHVLSPSEAYMILKKIPEQAINKLGMNREVARPEGLIMKCVPIPPNCTRTTDYKYVNNTTAVQFGSDNVTRTLQNLVTEIGRIHRTRTGKAMSRAQKEEATALQILTAHYLREKGAPKAVAGKEPQKRDLQGRVTKQDDHRWTKEWLSENMLGKNGNFTAKAVITGDPSLGISEIGVPWALAQKLTIPERATRWNITKLQECVDSKLLEFEVQKDDRPQKGKVQREKPGATRIERKGQAFQVLLGSTQTHKVLLGDVVHRNIQDGDYVYVNRPPSVHKHSLMALKVHVHHGLVITVNPLVCPPFNADFDGDIFHLFVPQSLQAIAELEQLMSVPQQIISDHGGQPLLALTQDTLLAAHLLTTSKLVVDKASMHQLCLWSSKEPPEAAIVKSPKGGPFWTGEQVFGLTLPANLNMGAASESVFIQEGEILKWIDGSKMLKKDNESIANALCNQLGPDGLVDYLNNAAGLLHAWLQVQGFSTGLKDFQVTNNLAARQTMLQSIHDEYYMKSIQESCDSVRILDAKAHAMGQDMEFNPDNLTKNISFLEQAAQQIFRARESDAESILAKYAEKDNSLLMMVKSGSKGSRGKLLQQLVGMGLQLYGGKHLLPFESTRRSAGSQSAVLNWWEEKGLVRSSLVDGLSAPGLFNHVTADRTGILRKHVEVAQPGTLFKSLMLFLRDLHVVYDGSVRSQCGNNLVQFCYGGAKGVPRPSALEANGAIVPFGEPGEGHIWDEDERARWQLSVLAGEPVGVLAATAISQPAYELMLDAPSLNGPFMPRPLELVQETLYPREKSDLKPCDRCVTIRLVHCECTDVRYCLEKRVLNVQAFLTRITLKTIAVNTAIQYWDMEDYRIAGTHGDALRFGSPWLGHIKISLDLMKQHQVDADDMLLRLREKFGDIVKHVKKQPMGQIFFCFNKSCKLSGGCCLHFSPRLPRKMQNQKDNDVYNQALYNLLLKIRRTIIPGLLDCTVKGDERLESVRIVSEGPARTTWHNKLTYMKDLDEELVLEIIVAEPPKAKLKRSQPWNSVKEACLPLMDMVDWNRSMPYSIQEIRHALGVETAYQMVNRRLGLSLEKTAPHTNSVHVKLIADMMTFSGAANGFNISGFQDMSKATAVSAPFNDASFKKPIRTLFDAASRGAKDSLQGVMTSCVWGKEAPLGTGTGFDIFWQPSKDMLRVATGQEAEKDIHAIWKDLDENCIPDKFVPYSPTHELPGLEVVPEGDLDEGAGFSPQHATFDDNAGDTWGNENGDGGADWGNGGEDAGAWGAASTQAAADDGWGNATKEKVTSGGGGAWDDLDAGEAKADDDDGWGAAASPAKKNNEDAWGATDTAKKSDDAWGTTDTAKKSDEDAWGASTDTAKKSNEADGWGDDAAEYGGTGDGWGDDAPKTGDEWGAPAPKTANQSTPATNGGAWEDNATKTGNGGGGGWDEAPAENGDTGDGWDNDISEKSKPTNEENGRSDDWGASTAVQESGDGGWDSVTTEAAASAWDSAPQTDGTEHNASKERHSEENERTRSSGGGRGRGRGGNDWSSRRNAHVSGANVVPLGVRRQFGASQGQSVGVGGQSQTQWNDSQSQQQEETSSAWDDVPATQDSTAMPTQPADQDADTEVDWSELVPGTTKADAWESFSMSPGKGGGWDAVLPETPGGRDRTNNNWNGSNAEDNPSNDQQSFQPRESYNSGGDGRGRGRGGRGNDWGGRGGGRGGNDWGGRGGGGRGNDWGGRGGGGRGNDWGGRGGGGRGNDWGGRGGGGRGNDWGGGRGRGRGPPRELQPEIEPENKEIDDLVKSMRKILKQNDIGRLPDKDDEAVRVVLAYHPNLAEKTGCGIGYIKVDKSPDYPDVNCFWLVRTDGTAHDFSYHKCLKEKIAREFPSFIDRYDELYTGRGRRAALLAAQTGPPPQKEPESQAEQAPAPSSMEDEQAPAPSAMQDEQAPAPSSMEDEQASAPSAMEDEQASTPSAMEDEQAPAPSAMQDEQAPAPSSMEDEQASARSAMEDEQALALSPMEDEQASAPSAMEVEQAPAPSSREEEEADAPVSSSIEERQDEEQSAAPTQASQSGW